MLVTTNFFDDFCQLETLPLCDSARQTAELVMQLLGWKVSMSDDKRLPFAYEFNMLGAVVDLTDSRKGWGSLCPRHEVRMVPLFRAMRDCLWIFQRLG